MVDTNWRSTNRGYDYEMKVCMLGDAGVGKTCLLHRIAADKFLQSYRCTIGADFKVRTVVVDGKICKMQLWDTAGQERYRSMSLSYFRNADAVIYVYDITSRRSFEGVKGWLQEFYKDNCLKYLVGNKCELEEKRKISRRRGAELAEEYDMNFYETSAKCEINCTDILIEIARKLQVQFEKRRAEAGDDNESVKLHNEQKENSWPWLSWCTII